MNNRKMWIAALGLAVAAGSFAVAEPSKEAKPSGEVEMKLPPGWTEADMQKMMVAGMPGKMHEHLTKGAGTWAGKGTMWMAPGAEPMHSDCTLVASSIMDGRYIKAEMSGEMPGMGQFNGLGFYGYDNLKKKFVSTWIDDHSTAMMNGVGEMSDDGKTITWTYGYICPLTDKPCTMRDVETITGADSKKLETFGVDPKSGKEYKMMSIEMTRKK